MANAGPSVHVRPVSLMHEPAQLRHAAGQGGSFARFRELLRAALAPAALFRFLRTVADEDRVVLAATTAWTAFALCFTGWDLPGVVGWENDGVAPRSFFSAVGENLTPGHGYRYPLFHGLVLLVCAVPVLLVCLVAGEPGELLARIRSLPAMCAFSIVTRLVHTLMGSAALLVLARVARRLFSRGAGRMTVLAWAGCLTVGYYARASNLDGPYMFWTVLAVDRALSASEGARAQDFVALGVLAALSVATKDQAYASYLLMLPVYLVVLPLWMRLPDRARRLRLAAATAASGVATYLLVAGVLVNPTGFVTRVGMLLGPNSQEWRTYERSWAGLWLNASDLWSAQPHFLWGSGLALLAWGGVLWALLGPAGTGLGQRVHRLLPFVAGLSSLLAFTLAVGRADVRCDQRFVLPMATWLCLYAGVGAEALRRSIRPRLLATCVLALLVVPSIQGTVALALTQRGDARWRVRALLAQLPAGSRVEVYGHTVYLPQLDLSPSAPYQVQRLDKRPAHERARLPGLIELTGTFHAVTERAPELVLVSEGVAQRYLPRPRRPGEIPSVVRTRDAADAEAVRFFTEAMAGRVPGYRLLCVLEAQLPALLRATGAEPVRMHDSTAQRQWLFVREGVRFTPDC